MDRWRIYIYNFFNHHKNIEAIKESQLVCKDIHPWLVVDHYHFSRSCLKSIKMLNFFLIVCDFFRLPTLPFNHKGRRISKNVRNVFSVSNETLVDLILWHNVLFDQWNAQESYFRTSCALWPIKLVLLSFG